MSNSDLFNRVALGDASLLTADQICERISIKRSTFDKWVRNSADRKLNELLSPAKRGHIPERKGFEASSFPQPDTRINGSPRWSSDTLADWLESQRKSTGRRPGRFTNNLA